MAATLGCGCFWLFKEWQNGLPLFHISVDLNLILIQIKEPGFRESSKFPKCDWLMFFLVFLGHLDTHFCLYILAWMASPAGHTESFLQATSRYWGSQSWAGCSVGGRAALGLWLFISQEETKVSQLSPARELLTFQATISYECLDPHISPAERISRLSSGNS